jgi:hypothetical protein
VERPLIPDAVKHIAPSGSRKPFFVANDAEWMRRGLDIPRHVSRPTDKLTSFIFNHLR